MKKTWLYLMALVVVIITFSSCASTKRDCQGVKHYKQKGGFYL